MASGEKSDVCGADKVGGRLARGRLARLDAELQARTSLQEAEAAPDKRSWRGGAGGVTEEEDGSELAEGRNN